MKLVRHPFAAILLVACAWSAPALAAREPVGHWQGTLQGMLRIVVHVEREAAGRLHGTMDSPDQGATGLPIDALAFEGDVLRFEMRAIGGGYSGRMTVSGDSLVGQWRQGGMELPLVLARVTAAAVTPRRPQEPKRPFPYDTVGVSFANPRASGVTLAGTLTRPRGTGPFPCVVLVSGSGPQDRDESVFGHRPFLVLADRLARRGIASLRTDDRGVGGSTGKFADATTEDFAGDVRAALDFLAKRSEIDRARIGLVGHSEGGLVATLVASRARDIAYVVLLASPGLPGDSILVHQSTALRRAMGVGEDALARESAIARRVYASLRAGDSAGVATEVAALVRVQLEGVPEAQRAAMGGSDSLAAAATRQMLSPWMRFFVTFDPRPALREVKCPVLALAGEKDLQVPATENLAAIREALAAGGNHDVLVRELPGLNHLFQTCTLCAPIEYGRIEETIAPAALDAIADWLVKKAQRGR